MSADPTLFGPDEGGWGEGDIAEEMPEDDAVVGPEAVFAPQRIHLGGGMYLVISRAMFKAMMHNPEITARVGARAAEIADEANSLAVVKGARYTYVVSNNPENIRARARVKPANAAGQIDDDVHSTLLKALANVGSDPKPDYTEDRPELPGEGEADYEQAPEQPELPFTTGEEVED